MSLNNRSVATRLYNLYNPSSSLHHVIMRNHSWLGSELTESNPETQTEGLRNNTWQPIIYSYNHSWLGSELTPSNPCSLFIIQVLRQNTKSPNFDQYTPPPQPIHDIWGTGTQDMQSQTINFGKFQPKCQKPSHQGLLLEIYNRQC